MQQSEHLALALECFQIHFILKFNTDERKQLTFLRKDKACDAR